MFNRIAFAAFLVLLLSGQAAMSDDAMRIPENAAAGGAASEANKEMEIGRYYIGKRNYTGAINRFKVVVTRYQSSAVVDEALFRLADAYLTLGIVQEAQTAAAVLDRMFPDSHWRSDARDMLKANGLEPAENERSWIIHAFPRTVGPQNLPGP
jgi:outer membrane protein assembly factor BamD